MFASRIHGVLESLAGGPELEILRNLVRDPQPVHALLLGALLIGMLAIVAVVEVMRQRRELISKAQGQWQSFEGSARDKGLGTEDLVILRQLHDSLDSLHAPDALLRIPAVYDRALDAWLDKRQGRPVEWDRLERIRKSLGFKGLSGETSLSHTRQIADGQQVRLVAEDGDAAVLGMVASNHEERLVLLPEGPFNVPQGSNVRLAFSRQGDGEYKASLPLLGFDAERGRILLGHSPKLARQQLRMWVRVSVLLPGYMRNVTLTNGELLDPCDFEVTLLDLSGGGCMISSRLPLEIETRGTIDFQLGDARIESLKFVMLRSGRATKDGGHICHLCFENIELQAQEKVMRYVFERQRLGHHLR